MVQNIVPGKNNGIKPELAGQNENNTGGRRSVSLLPYPDIIQGARRRGQPLHHRFADVKWVHNIS